MVKSKRRQRGRELDIERDRYDNESERRPFKQQQERGARPTHLLRIKSVDRNEKGWATVGVAWERDAGLMSMRLNKGVVLDWHDFYGGGAFTLILVPNDDED